MLTLPIAGVGPKRVLIGTGCVGGALCLWALATVIIICGCYVWNECAFGMPQMTIQGEKEPRGVPKNAGEKNFVEFAFPNHGAKPPHIRTTCSFAVMFMLLYNLSANAIAFALQVMTASGSYNASSGDVPARSTVIGIAIGALTLVIIAHTLSRQGGIFINNAFAIIKVALLIIIFALGAAKASGRLGGSGQVARNNFTEGVWTTQRADVGSWSESLMLCLFAFHGFEQPFYIITEARSPRRYFPKYTILAVLIAAVLFMLVNISYLLVIDKDDILPGDGNYNGWYLSPDLATMFFDKVFEGDHDRAARAMSAVIAICIFGNLWVMTFTAARVKQEIAKEGILPWSLLFATSYRTPYGFCQQWFSKTKLSPALIDRAPTAAFGLHWFTSVLLIAVTAPIKDPRSSYSILVYLFTYSIVLVLGGWVALGLALVKFNRTSHWQERRRYRPWLSPFHTVFYLLATSFLAVTAFVPPSRDSPFFHSFTGVPWYVLPAIGISAPFWGIMWYYGFRLYERVTHTELEIIRKPTCVPDSKYPEEYVQRAELISLWWPVQTKGKMANDFVEDAVSHDDRAINSHEETELENVSGRLNVQHNSREPVEDERRLSDSF